MRDEDDQLYIYKLYGVSVPRRIKAMNMLRTRIGVAGKITAEQIEKAQNEIENPKLDFRDHIFHSLSAIEGVMDGMVQDFYRRDGGDHDLFMMPLINIKSHAGMFGYPFVSDLSAIVLQFIERYNQLDDDMLNVVVVYCRAIRVAYENEIRDSKSSAGQTLIKELTHAMDRYAEKFKKKTGR